MKITAYFKQLRELIEECPYVSFFDIYEDARSNYEGVIKARINFVDSSFLEFREYVNTGLRRIQKYSYSYHFQKSNKLVFRYDNTPHHPHLKSFPHHKHLNSGKVIESKAAALKHVLAEIVTHIT